MNASESIGARARSLMRSAADSLDAARERYRVEQIGPLEDLNVRLPVSGAEYRVTRPSDVDALLNLAEHDPEENLPYWAALWPSGIALADAVIAEPALVNDQNVLELGSGLGVTAMAALGSGAKLTISDYSSESLRLALYNIYSNGLSEPNSIQMNWRTPSADFRAVVGDGFPVVLAADVLYEARDVEPLLELLEWIVAPEGLVWLAEPRRPTAAKFIDLATEQGWTDEIDCYDGPWPEMNDTGVVVRVHRLRRRLEMQRTG